MAKDRAMAKLEGVEIDMQKLMNGVTVSVAVKNSHKFKARTWLGLKLMRFAGWVIGCNIEIDWFAIRPTNEDE